MSHIYIHVPFCLRKCPYCAFYSLAAPDDDIMNRYVTALIKEVSRRPWSWESTRTVFFGGGTPTLLGPKRVGKILRSLPLFDQWGAQAEITMEANPGTVSADQLEQYQQAGINRISIGVQSLSNARLKFLERQHTAKQALELVQAAAARPGLRVSADLIYGLPQQLFSGFAKDVRRLMEAGVGHLASYLLSAEDETLLGYRCERKEVRLPSDLAQFRFLARVHALVGELGWDLYEVSNFAKTPELRCQHNMAYWRRSPYLGLGPAAHSFDGTTRSWNPPSLGRWLKASKSGESILESEVLTHEQHVLETLMLGLRTSEGFSLDSIRPHCTPEGFEVLVHAFEPELTYLHLVKEGQQIRPTGEGLYWADRIPVWVTERAEKEVPQVYLPPTIS